MNTGTGDRDSTRAAVLKRLGRLRITLPQKVATIKSPAAKTAEDVV